MLLKVGHSLLKMWIVLNGFLQRLKCIVTESQRNWTCIPPVYEIFKLLKQIKDRKQTKMTTITFFELGNELLCIYGKCMSLCMQLTVCSDRLSGQVGKVNFSGWWLCLTTVTSTCDRHIMRRCTDESCCRNQFCSYLQRLEESSNTLSPAQSETGPRRGAVHASTVRHRLILNGVINAINS